MRVIIVGALVSLIVSCGGSSANPCTAGASVACTCPNGKSGALSLQKGGGMAGTLNCTIKGGATTTAHTVVVQGSFQGPFAP